MARDKMLTALADLAARRGQRALRRHAVASAAHQLVEHRLRDCITASEAVRTAKTQADASLRADPASVAARYWHQHQLDQAERAAAALANAQAAVDHSAQILDRLRREVHVAETKSDAIGQRLNEHSRIEANLADERANDDRPTQRGRSPCQ